MNRPPIVDLHCDTLGALEPEERNLDEWSNRGQLDLPRLEEGGVSVQFFAVFVPRTHIAQGKATLRALHLIDLFHRQLAQRGGLWRPAGDFQEVEAAIRDGGRAACLSLEGGEALGEDLGVLRILRRLGVASVGLTWNHRNGLGCGCLDGEQEGLTPFGRSVVAEAVRLRMMVDVAHLNQAGFWEVLDACPAPVIVSHANAHRRMAHPRNLRDEQIVALAAKGGVMGLTFVPAFLGEHGVSRRVLLEHLDHVVGLVGSAAVGLGSDFDGFGAGAAGLEDAAALVDLDEDLLRLGYNDDQVAAILGGNWLRVMRETI